MRRCLALVAVGMAVLALVWAGGRLTFPETLAKGRGDPPPALGLEKIFSGGWLMQVHEPGGTVEVVLGLGAGGLVVMNGTPTPNGKITTTAAGSWRPAGPREIEGTFLIFMRNFDMSTACYEKATISMTLGDDGNSLEGDAMIYVYVPPQDPLDPDVVPVMAVPVPVDARRIVIE